MPEPSPSAQCRQARCSPICLVLPHSRSTGLDERDIRLCRVKPMAGFAWRAIPPTTSGARSTARRACRSDVELCLEDLVDGLRVRLAPGGLHHLAYEPSDHRGLRFRLSNLVGIAGNDIIDELFNRGCVGQLL